MRAVLVTHSSSMEHDTGWGHPERAARVPAVVKGVRDSGLEVIEHEPEPASKDLLATVHDRDYVDFIESFCGRGGGALDPDTVATEASWLAARCAAQGSVDAVAMLRAGDAEVGFVAMRPPGHHALRDRAMGFCLFNNIALAARAITGAGERVAIIDWDVHHGNGTETTFANDPDVLYVSWHQYPFYPGTGWLDDLPRGGHSPMTINFPWPGGTDGGPYHWTMTHGVVPVLERFRPEWVLVSAGYDAHRDDPLADIRLEADDYGRLASSLASVVPPGRMCFMLEGGYDLVALEESAKATLRGASGAWPADTAGPEGGDAAWTLARRVVNRVREDWELG